MKYKIGDTFINREDMNSRVRLRVRSVTKLPHWHEPRYILQLYSCRSYYPENPAASKWGWLDKTHDRHFTGNQIKNFGWHLIARGQKPASVQGELFPEMEMI